MAGSKMLMGWLAVGLLEMFFILASGDSLAHPRSNFKGTRYEKPNAETQALGSDQVSKVEYVDGPLAPLYDFLIQRRLQRFCKLLRDAGLEQIINDLGGSWTLFAPTDSSFIFMPGGALEDLQRNPQLLRDFILYHFVAGDFPSSQIQNDMLLDSVQGSPLRFNVYAKGKTVSGAQILEPDLLFEMGRVYIVDRPLYPIPSMDMVTYLQRNHREMYRLLIDAGLLDYISSGTFTFLVPDDQAFDYLSLELKDALKTNTTLAERILLNHILPGSLYVGGITDGMQWQTVGDSLVTFTLKRGLTFANDIPIVQPDVPLTNGVIHVLNRVLLPEGIDADCQCKPSKETGPRLGQVPGSSRPSFGQNQRPQWGQGTTTRPGQSVTRHTPRPFGEQPQSPSDIPGQPGQRGSQGRPQDPVISPGQPGSRPWSPSRTGQPARPVPPPSQTTRSQYLPQPTQPPSDDDINSVIGTGVQPDSGQRKPDQARPQGTRYPPVPVPPQRQRPTTRPQIVDNQPQDGSYPGSGNENYPEQGVTPGAPQTTRQTDRWTIRQRTPTPRYPTPQRGAYGTPTTLRPQTTRNVWNQPKVTQPSLEQPNEGAGIDSTVVNQDQRFQTQRPTAQTTSWQQRNQITQTTRQPYQPPRQPPQPPQRRTTSRPSYGRTTVSPQAPSNEQSFEPNRQQPNCRRQGDRVTTFNRNLPVCSESSPEGCQSPPYDPSDARPLCPGPDGQDCRDPNSPYNPSDNRPLCPTSVSPQDCREFGQPTHTGDRRPLCTPSSVPQTGCRDPSAPYNPSDRRPVCRTTSTQSVPSQPTQGGEEPKEDCRPFLERPQPGDRRPVCKVNRQPSGPKPTKDADKTQKKPDKPQRGQYPTHPPRRQSWQSSTRAPQSWQTTRQPAEQQPQTGSNQTPFQPGDSSFQTRPQTGSQQTQTGSYPFGRQPGKTPQTGADLQPEVGADPQVQPEQEPAQPQTGSHPFQPQTGTHPSQAQTGVHPSQPHAESHISQPQPGSPHPSQPQTGSYPPQQPGSPQSGSYPTQRPGSPQSGSYPTQRPGSPQSGSYTTRRPGSPQTGSYPPQRPGSAQSGSYPSPPQTGSYPPQRPGSPQSGSYPSPPQAGSYPTQRPGSPHSGSYPTRRPGSPESDSYPTQQPGSPQSGQPLQPQSESQPSHPFSGVQPSQQQPGSPSPSQPASGHGQSQTGRPAPGYPQRRPGSQQTQTRFTTSQPSTQGVPRPGSVDGRPVQPVIPQGRPGSFVTPSRRPVTTTTRVPISVLGTSTTPGEDTRRTLYEIVEDPALLIRGRPVKLTKIFELFHKAGIEDILNEPGPTTVFLPSDDAFALLPRGVVEQLEENPELLRQVLLYHVTRSEILPSAQPDSYTVPSVEGNQLVITMLNGGRLIFISGAKAVAVTRANNGIFYVINQLLYPLPHHDIVGAIQSRPDLSTLAFLLPLSGLTEMLRGQTPYTLLAPTDNAFAQLPQSVYEELTRNTTALQEILLNHIIEGAHYGREFFAGGTFPSARGGKLKFQVVSYGYQVNDVNIKTPEIVTGSGVIHLVDQILLEEPDLKFFTSLENSVAGEDVTGTNAQQPSAGPQQPGAPASGSHGPVSGQHFPGSQQTGISQPQVGGLQPPHGQQVPPGRVPAPGQGTFGNQPTSPGQPQGPSFGGQRQPGVGQQTPSQPAFGGQRQPGVNQPTHSQQIPGQPAGPPSFGGQRQPSVGQPTPGQQTPGQPAGPSSFGGQRQPGVSQPSHGQQTPGQPAGPSSFGGPRQPGVGQPTHGQQTPGQTTGPSSFGGQRQPVVGQPTPGQQTPGQPAGPSFSGQRQPSTQGHGRQPATQPGQPTHGGQQIPGQPGHASVSGQRIPSHGQRLPTATFDSQRRPGTGGQTSSVGYQGFQTGGQPHDVAELARSMGLNKFANWITNTGLLEKIHDGGVYTVFAPTDDAVESLPQEMSYSIQSNPEQVKSILQYHIVPQRLNLNSVTNEETASTLLQGKNIRFNVYQNLQPDCRQLVTASGTPVGQALATMGSIQVIPVTQVLYQPAGNLLKIVEASPILQQLNEAVKNARLTWILTGNGPMTIFAPSDVAFQSLTEDQRKTLVEDKQAFTDLLKRHIVRGTFFSSGIQDDIDKKSENNKPVKLSLQEGILTVNSVPVTYSDITATNGVLHVIDHFL